MLVTYTAVDGFSISDSSTGAWLMSDTDATMITDQTGNSPTKTLTENGSVTTAVVASNSSTLAASGFSASNYYSRAYDADFDPGTSGLSVSIWFKLDTSATTHFLFQRDSTTTGKNYRCYMDSSGLINFNCDDNSTDRSAQSPTAYDDDEWHMMAGVFDGTDVDLYIDGAFVDNATGSALTTLSNGTAVLRIGREVNGSSFPFGGSLSGIDLDIGTQWTAQEIKNKYESERVLFQQLETFSIVGQSLEYEVSLSNASTGNAVSEAFTETLDGSRSGLTWYRKKVFNCSTIHFARTSLPAAMKFLKSTNNVSFTYDERGTSSAEDNPITVYKTSQNEQINYSNPYYQFSFSLREA